jgi:hypothetical protein
MSNLSGIYCYFFLNLFDNQGKSLLTQIFRTAKKYSPLKLQSMKHLFLPIFVLALLSSCASLKVTQDYDKTAPFATYKTYQFTPEVASLPVGDLNRSRLVAAVETELAAKGFTKSDKPDVLIDLKVKAKEIQTATANTTGGYGGYGRGYRYGWGGGFSTTTINYDSYTEGTVFFDMIDVAKNQLVWQGRAVGTFEPDLSAEKREANIKNGTHQVFMQYPPKK